MFLALTVGATIFLILRYRNALLTRRYNHIVRKSLSPKEGLFIYYNNIIYAKKRKTPLFERKRGEMRGSAPPPARGAALNPASFF